MGDTIRLDAEPRSVGRARRFCSAILERRGVGGDMLDICVLLVSELATNAVLHARTPFTVTIDACDAVLRIEVHDDDPRPPHPRDYGPEASSGRGMHLVEALSESSGSDADDHGGKSVWFEMAWDAEMAG